MISKVSAVARKELAVYFASPVAYIFIGTFLLVSMFIFFWVESFFARNITDVRPLFDWMPVLLVFLVSALTMRMWSEERRMGTVEFLMTVPVNTLHLVLGKFFACLILVGIALFLTLPIPFSVAFMGNLDWGPVIGAYLASILLAGAYVAVGLFISANTESQIVSLMLSIILCFLLYVIGASTLTGLVGNFWAEILRLIGTGSRFESINRGVIDLRDLYYYISVIGTFVALNILTLERLKWSEVVTKPRHTWLNWLTVLSILNLLLANFWLQKANYVRVDLTAGNQYTISEATRNVLNQLQEPLLIRGYFSAKTHPLLAPLVPQVRDMLSEYSVYGEGKVKSEFLDPRENEEIEKEASEKYNIRPVPFQVADRYQAALVNSYFNILVSYGDKFEVLSFRDLIEVKMRNETGIDVQLRNLEYDLTSTIKKVMSGFRTTDSFFAALKNPIKLNAYVSDRTQLPPKLAEYLAGVETVAAELEAGAADKFELNLIDPQANEGQVAKEIMDKYGMQPMVTSLLDPKQFYFYLLLENGEELVQLALPENLNVEGARQSIEAGLKRFSPGFLKTIGLSTPPVQSSHPLMMQGAPPEGRHFNILRQKLEQTHSIKPVELSNGSVPDDIDLLLVAAPENLGDKDQFAIDQFLMRGGTVVLSTAPLSIKRTNDSLASSVHTSGLENWLKHHGVSLERELVMDKYNESYPVPVRRNLGAFSVQEIRLVNYPPFVDIRESGLAKHGITAGIQQVTMNWVTPVNVSKSDKIKSTVLLKSSKHSWATNDTRTEPDFRAYPELGFPIIGEQGAKPLAVLLEGEFVSYYRGKQSPLLSDVQDTKPKEEDSKTAERPAVFASVVEKSPSSARLIVYGSNEFLTDQVLAISQSTGSERYLNSLQLAENTVDWALEDADLLTIRNRGHFSRTLLPLTEQAKMFWEYGNYIFALLGLLCMYWLAHSYRANLKQRYSHYVEA